MFTAADEQAFVMFVRTEGSVANVRFRDSQSPYQKSLQPLVSTVGLVVIATAPRFAAMCVARLILGRH